MKPHALLITDLDETLYSWVDYFAPCFRAMVHVLSRETGVDELTITQDFKNVYARHGSLEYSFSVQDLDLCRDRPQSEVKELIRKARGAFNRVRQKNLRCYAGVKETLMWESSQRISTVGLTNAPIFQAERRLQQLRIDHLFSGLAGWVGYDVPSDDPYTDAIRLRLEHGKYRSKISQLWPILDDERKPSSKGYEKIISEMGLSVAWVFAIGDDMKKDIEPAMALGVTGIWAEYGGSFQEKNWETLKSITPWKSPQVEQSRERRGDIDPNFAVSSFDQLQLIIPVPQPRLYGF